MGKSEQGKEGSFLLGDPTFIEIGGGRWRCVETGQEMPEKEKESYSKSRACRVGLINAAVGNRKPPLNTFEPHPVSKSQLICKLTGDTVNKTEEQIWKHISGRRFQNKLEKMELQANSPPPVEAVKEKKKKKSQKMDLQANSPPPVEAVKEKKKKKSEKMDLQTNSPPPVEAVKEKKIKKSKELVESKKSHIKNLKKDKKKKNQEIDSNDNVESINGGDKEEETNFWMPPDGERWDFDDGKDRWESCQSTDLKEDSHCNSANGVVVSEDTDGKKDSESNELTTRTKRLSIAVGPSSFASRKKKIKRPSQADQHES